MTTCLGAWRSNSRSASRRRAASRLASRRSARPMRPAAGARRRVPARARRSVRPTLPAGTRLRARACARRRGQRRRPCPRFPERRRSRPLGHRGALHLDRRPHRRRYPAIPRPRPSLRRRRGPRADRRRCLHGNLRGDRRLRHPPNRRRARLPSHRRGRRRSPRRARPHVPRGSRRGGRRLHPACARPQILHRSRQRARRRFMATR